MRREARALKTKGIEALVTAVEFFNRPNDQGRVTAVLFFLQHSLEMLLKAAILDARGTICPPGDAHSHGFEKCVNIGADDLGILTNDDRRALNALNGLRDCATHNLLEVPEPQLYVHAQAAVSTFDRLLRNLCGDSLARYLPQRVLPLSTKAPQDLELIMDEEFRELRNLVAQGRRQMHAARPRLRHLLIVDSSLRDEPAMPSNADVWDAVEQLREAETWRTVFPGVAAARLDADGEGPTFSLRIARQGDLVARPLAEGEDPATAVAYREVSEFDRYPLRMRDLAEKLGLTEPKARALALHLDVFADRNCHREIRDHSTRLLRYSSTCLERMREALKTVDMEVVWREHRPGRSPSRPETVPQ